jgi:hypothetical protein
MEPTVHLTLAESGSDQTRLDQLSRMLRDELRQLDGTEVQPGRSQPAPPGARGDASTVGTLAVALMGSGGLTAVITAVRAWLDRGTRLRGASGWRWTATSSSCPEPRRPSTTSWSRSS